MVVYSSLVRYIYFGHYGRHGELPESWSSRFIRPYATVSRLPEAQAIRAQILLLSLVSRLPLSQA